MDVNVLTQVGLLAGVNYGVVDYILAPLKSAYPEQSKGWWWLLYVPLTTGFVITFLAGLNLFTDLIPSMSQTLGVVLTAVAAGCGNNVLYRLFGKTTETVKE